MNRSLESRIYSTIFLWGLLAIIEIMIYNDTSPKMNNNIRIIAMIWMFIGTCVVQVSNMIRWGSREVKHDD